MVDIMKRSDTCLDHSNNLEYKDNYYDFYG